MYLTRYTDYAFRVLFYLGAAEGRAVPISEMARAYDISRNHLVKVVHGLVKAGYLRSTRGRNGGVSLARPSTTIRLGEVVRDTEPDLKLVECAGCVIAKGCALPRPLREAMRAFMQTLDGYSLADVVADTRGLKALVGGH